MNTLKCETFHNAKLPEDLAFLAGLVCLAGPAIPVHPEGPEVLEFPGCLVALAFLVRPELLVDLGCPEM